jgi:hypothetical protein
MVGLCGFVALAVDVGMIAVARTQAQNAADTAALTAARSIDGSAAPNLVQATTNGQTAATANGMMGHLLQTSEVALQHGTYHYDYTAQTFSPQFTVTAPDTYNLSQATVTRTVNTAFARVLGMASLNVIATATAAHRPRDVSVVLDFSGSMNDESDLWNNVTPNYLGTMNNTPNSNDPLYPLFGHYSAASSISQMQNTSADTRVGKSNVSSTAVGVAAMVDDFYQHSRGGATAAAFTAASSAFATTPGGDNYLPTFGTNTTPRTYAQTVRGITNGATFGGYKQPPFTGYGGTAIPAFSGYTRGPAHWGKTFFIWPPDPAAGNDWRLKFFGTNDNTRLWDSAGNWKTPAGNYAINYSAILNWIAAAPNPFPPRLRGGRCIYYDVIPTTVINAASDSNQRFWKEYIDYTIGVWTDPSGITWPLVNDGSYTATSLGPDYTWGTIRVSSPPGGGSPYMNIDDNPQRPRHRFWFGPMTMIQFLSDTAHLPGTAHDISMRSAKDGIAAALQDIQNNHPNDLVSMILFNRPQFSTDPPGVGAFNKAQSNLSRDYQSMINSLWYPPNSGTSDVRIYDSNETQSPHAGSDYTYNTATSYGLMLAYNQFSGNSALQTQAVGGLGRKGAQRLVILETDGMANVDSHPTSGFTSNGLNSYYNILPGQTITSGAYDQNALLQVVQAICNKANGTPGSSPGYASNPGYPGFATTGKPVLIQTLVFGALFESAAASTLQSTIVSLMQQISSIGGTTFPSSASDPTNGYKWIVGDQASRTSNLRQAFVKAMDDGASVSLVR